MLDGKLWVNESGLIDFKLNSDTAVSYTISDAENIILNSTSIDNKQDEVKTRIILYYGRSDPTKDDKENYSNVHVEIDADAEGAFEYNEKLSKEITTTWINSDCGTTAAIEAYTAAKCKSKLTRMRSARPILTLDVELKDSDILAGKLVYLNSDEFNNIDGSNYNNQIFEVIKKDPKGNKITLILQFYPTASITTVSENYIQILENPIAFTKYNLREVRVTGLTVNGYTGDTNDLNAEDKVSLVWDNMYKSEATSATDILGVIKSLPKIWPINNPDLWSYDTSSWKTVRKYNVYMFVGNQGITGPVTHRPTTNDVNGKWYKIAIVQDQKIEDAAKKYNLDYNLPISLIARYIAFDVYADANLVFDPNAPVGIEVKELQ